MDRPALQAELELTLTGAVTHFAHIPGIYDHWSVLCRYTGTVADEAVDLPLPFHSFVYHVLNLDETTQALVSEVLGPAGVPVLQAVYLRHTDGRASVHTRGFRHTVRSYAAQPLVTPDGRDARAVSGELVDRGRRRSAAAGDRRRDLWRLHLRPRRRLRRPVEGTGYLEWITR